MLLHRQNRKVAPAAIRSNERPAGNAADAPLAAVGSTIRTTITWTKTRIQRIITRHKLFIATSVSYRDALAGAMALIAALFGMTKEIATLVGLAVSSLQRFFAQRTFIDDAQDNEDDDGFEGLQNWRPQPNW